MAADAEMAVAAVEIQAAVAADADKYTQSLNKKFPRFIRGNFINEKNTSII